MTSIGEVLAEGRHQKGITPKDVEKYIKIRAKYISALEQNDFDIIPGQAYVVGFIKTYANFLGLDGAELVRRYQEDFGSSAQSNDYKIYNVSIAGPELNKPEGGTKGPVRLFVVILGLILVIALFKSVAGVMISRRHHGPSKHVEKIDKKISKPAAAVDTTASVIPNQFVFTVRIREAGGSWLRVTVDGNKTFEGTLSQGEKTWNVKQEVEVRAGKAAAVEIIRDGKSLGLLDPAQSVVTKVFKVGDR